MSHVVFVSLAYGASVIALTGLLAWIVADHRARRRELDVLEQTGVRRRSSENTEHSA